MLIPSLLPASEDLLDRAIVEAYEGARHQLEIKPFEGGLDGIFPVYGALSMTEAITFRWRGKKIQGALPVFVFGKKTFSIRPRDKKIILSAEALGLKSGQKYEWYLGRKEGEKIIAQSRVFRFEILSSQSADRLKKDLENLISLPAKTKEGRRFMEAQIYYKYRMYHAMVALLEPLYKMAPTESLRKPLFLGYVKLGRHHEAKKFAPNFGAPKNHR